MTGEGGAGVDMIPVWGADTQYLSQRRGSQAERARVHGELLQQQHCPPSDAAAHDDPARPSAPS